MGGDLLPEMLLEACAGGCVGCGRVCRVRYSSKLMCTGVGSGGR